MTLSKLRGFRLAPLVFVGCWAVLAAGAQEAGPEDGGGEGGEEAPEPVPPDIALGPTHIATVEDVAMMELAEPLRIADDLVVTHAGVGYLKAGEDGKHAVFVRTDTIVREDGGNFGWVLRFDTTRTEITLQEKFTLPAANAVWSVDESVTTVAEDGLSATSVTIFDGVWDWVFNFWTFDPGDPEGGHAFTLTLDDVTLAEFAFDVVAPQD